MCVIRLKFAANPLLHIVHTCAMIFTFSAVSVFGRIRAGMGFMEACGGAIGFGFLL